MSFEDLGLQAVLLDSVRKQGYTTPTPIQLKAIPRVLEGRDVLAGAQTGTGKTAAFTLPMLQLLDKRQHHGRGRAPRALILTPTRELAAQVGDSVSTYGRKMRIDSAIIFGGVGINPQIQKLKRGLDIVIATPGRLLDHAGQRTLDLSKIEILVLDEADRMLDMGFIHDIKKIIKLLPIERQNLLFSATYSEDIKRLADGLLCNPELIEVAPRNAATELVTQVVHPVSKAKKRALLSKLISEGNWSQVLVFSRTKHGANKLSKQLSTDGISATAIHGNKSQGARTKALADFKRGSVRVLVATDIAARGLDIDSLPHVVNFDLPHVPEDYVHRIGRTGRAGESGRAHSLVSQEERSQLRDIERLLNRKIDVEKIEGFDDLTLATDGAERFKRGGGGRPKANRSSSGRSGESGNGRRGQGGYAGKGASRGSGSRSGSSRGR